MTDTTTGTADRGSSLASMLLPELKQLAQQLGITGSSGMRKQELIAAISERQQQGGAPRRGSRSATRDAGSPDSAGSADTQDSASKASKADGGGSSESSEGSSRNDRNDRNDRKPT